MAGPADIPNVESVFANPELIKPGIHIGLVCHVDGQPHMVATEVVPSDGLTLRAPLNRKECFGKGQKILMIYQDAWTFSKADAIVRQIDESSDSINLVIDSVNWEKVDRRRYPRHEMAIHVALKAVVEQDTNVEIKHVECMTADLSLGGAWIETEHQLQPGSLVEFQTSLNGRTMVRILSVVAWSSSEKKGCGIEFIDFIGGARYYLHDFLSKAA